ncbi:hypothetical protein CDAR_228821 [Caerostris darwini]|uniref:Uncharacterized protein n=1 Tax=Caerostris darwini TaxID=1538125 RepID=A0AAV4PAE8_9ARAC|nr:hypothetical protein CDAR_228821 [Caerostris darwini]
MIALGYDCLFATNIDLLLLEELQGTLRIIQQACLALQESYKQDLSLLSEFQIRLPRLGNTKRYSLVHSGTSRRILLTRFFFASRDSIPASLVKKPKGATWPL